MKKITTATLGGRRAKISELRVHGEAWHPDMKAGRGNSPTMWIDYTLRSRARLETIIHEAMHLQRPTAPEEDITRDAKEMAALLWRFGYRGES
jgi:hypothetical protein